MSKVLGCNFCWDSRTRFGVKKSELVFILGQKKKKKGWKPGNFNNFFPWNFGHANRVLAGSSSLNWVNLRLPKLVRELVPNKVGVFLLICASRPSFLTMVQCYIPGPWPFWFLNPTPNEHPSPFFYFFFPGLFSSSLGLCFGPYQTILGPTEALMAYVKLPKLRVFRVMFTVMHPTSFYIKKKFIIFLLHNSLMHHLNQWSVSEVPKSVYLLLEKPSESKPSTSIFFSCSFFYFFNALLSWQSF